MAYSEHVGIYRQAGGNMGEMAHLYPLRRYSKADLTSFFMNSSLIARGRTVIVIRARSPRRISVLAFDQFKRFFHFLLYLRELGGQQRLFRIDDHVHSDLVVSSQKPYSLAQTASHPVPNYRAAERPAHGKPHAKVLRRLALQVKNRHVRGKMALALFVDALKIRVPQKTAAAWKSFADGRPHNSRISRSETTITVLIRPHICIEKEEALLTKARLHRDAFASLGAATRDHGAPILGLHTSAEAVDFGTFAPIRLECTLGHVK